MSSINTNELFLKIYNNAQEDIQCPIETLIALCVYQFCEVRNVKVIFVTVTKKSEEHFIRINIENIPYQRISENELSWEVLSCKLPVFYTKNRIITGLCAVSRYICKYKEIISNNPIHPDGLLGFRKSCLQAPNEVSIWTKFCEIEIPETAIKLLTDVSIEETCYHVPDTAIKLLTDVSIEETCYHVPDTLVKFEKHLLQPLRIHNIYKVANDIIKKDSGSLKTNEVPILNDDKSPRIKTKQRHWKSKSVTTNDNYSVPIESLGLEHSFAEGPFLTLADVLLYPCYYIILSLLNIEYLEKKLPNTIKWFEKLKTLNFFDKINSVLSINSFSSLHKNKPDINYEYPEALDQSLYKSDPKRHNSRKRLFTKESDVELALSFVQENMELGLLQNELHNSNKKIDWQTIPAAANPYGGHLPDKRKDRKTQQLENLALSVLNIAQDGDRIVDFCSGSGHLGILLAFLLPKCTIILLENKEESLNRASDRVENLNLTNVYLFQCNLDFFTGSFDIGVALHACGIATDLVIENCIGKNASFVVCPCCYGSLHVTDRMLYPRSREFSKLPLDMYMCIGHAADQTHKDHPLQIRGGRCMAIIDSDRSHHAINNGYNVQLTRLHPLNCTPKNMLIIGISEPNNIANRIKNL